MDIGGILQNLGLNLGGLIFNVLNLLFIYWLLNKYVFSKLGGYLDERQKIVAKTIEDAEKVESELKNARQKSNDIIKAAQNEATEIVEESKHSAEKLAVEMRAETEAHMQELLDRARKLAAAEREDSLKAVRAELANIISTATAKLVQKEVSPNRSEQLVSDMIADIKK